MTLLNLLPPALYSLLSGCQVRRRQASSAALDMDSRRDQPTEDTVGDEIMLPVPGEKTPALEAFMAPAPKSGLPRARFCGEWNGFPAAEGTLSLLPGVRLPEAYMLWAREWTDAGDAMPDHRGLLCPVENVPEVGVLNSLGEGAR